MNKPVSFQMAELLKEKGFYKPLPSICFIKEEYNYTSTMVYEVLDMNFEYILRPTISDVVMWLYEKHGIWIEVRHIKTFNVNRFHVIIWDYKDTSDYMTIHCDNGVGYEVWDSPTEAYEVAVEYTLNNLM